MARTFVTEGSALYRDEYLKVDGVWRIKVSTYERIYERVDRSVYYNSAAVIDADGSLLGVYRKNHIPLNTIFYEKLYFKPGNLGYPVFNTLYGKVGILIGNNAGTTQLEADNFNATAQ